MRASPYREREIERERERERERKRPPLWCTPPYSMQSVWACAGHVPCVNAYIVASPSSSLLSSSPYSLSFLISAFLFYVSFFRSFFRSFFLRYYVTVFADICSHMNLPLLNTVTNVYCDGIFDLLHRGHMEQFRQAHDCVPGGTRLFVGVCVRESNYLIFMFSVPW